MTAPCWVYYAKRDGMIKIGFSEHVSHRTRAQKAELLAVEAAGDLRKDLERARHRQFGHLRVEGEWFRPAPDLLEHVAALRDQEDRPGSISFRPPMTGQCGFKLPLSLRRKALTKAIAEGTFLGTVLVEFLEQYVGEIAREQAS